MIWQTEPPARGGGRIAVSCASDAIHEVRTLPLTQHNLARPSSLLDVESSFAHLGDSLLRINHRRRNAETGADVARLNQFGVHLDLGSCRPSRTPGHLRKRSQTLLAKG